MNAGNRPRWGLRTRLMLILALSSITPTVLLGALAIRNARLDVQHEVIRGNLALIRAIGQGLNTTLQDTRRTLQVAASAWAEGSAMSRLLRRLRGELSMLRAVALLDPAGRHVGGDALGAVPFAPDLANSYGGYVSGVIGDRRREVLMVVQARDRRGELTGFLAGLVDLGFVQQRLAETRLGPGASLLVVDGSGRPVAHNGPLPAATAAPGGSLRDANPAIDRMLATYVEGHLELSDDAGRRWVAVYRNIAGMSEFRGVRWGVLLQQPVEHAYALARKATRDTLLVAGVVLLVALTLGAWVARRIGRPLGRLVAQSEEVAAGNLELTVTPSGGSAEIALLTRRFGEMVESLRERARLEQQLVRSEKLSSVGVLAAGVAHEINNPLTTIFGYAKLMLEGRAEDDPDRPALELVADEAQRVQAIVRELLDFSRQERGEIRPLSLNAVVERALNLVQPDLGKRGIRVERALHTELPPVPADEARIEQVFVNLLTNAAHAMKDGGRLDVRSAHDTRRVWVEIADDGAGISAEDLGRIFDPFFTSKDPGVGTGLGLSIAHRIVTALGGTIEVESSPARGSTFRVLLPRGGDEAAQSSDASSASSS